jgi:transposase-like protein
MGCDYNIDEVSVTINGARHDLWRAVDQGRHVLDILVQPRCTKKAAKNFFRKLPKGCRYIPVGPVRDSARWQHHVEGAYALEPCTIDWAAYSTRCPQGQRSASWYPF